MDVAYIRSKACKVLGLVYRRFYKYADPSALTVCLTGMTNMQMSFGTLTCRKTKQILKLSKDSGYKSVPSNGMMN